MAADELFHGGPDDEGRIDLNNDEELSRVKDVREHLIGEFTSAGPTA